MLFLNLILKGQDKMYIISPAEASIIFRVLVAAVLGILIGLQRERRKLLDKKPGVAGLRTHTLICVGAALISAGGSILYAGNVLFLAGSIMTGIGFIGAGSVIASQGKLRGLVNAASIWVTGTIGVTCGLGLYASAVVASIVTLAILELKRFEKID